VSTIPQNLQGTLSAILPAFMVITNFGQQLIDGGRPSFGLAAL